MGNRAAGVEMEKMGSSDSLHGLKFGKKIYFEDAGGGGGSSKASAEASQALPAPKKAKAVVQGTQQPPRCQVEGCNLDLSDAKAYYSRHKVCGMHSKYPKVIVGGLEQRFCQQCSRFHLLPEFDQGKRSCRRRLAGHNERRRKPPPGLLATRFGRLASSFHEDNNRFRGFLMDFSYPKAQGAPRGIWPTVRPGDRVIRNQRQAGLHAAAKGITSHGTHQYMQAPTGGAFFSARGIPPGNCLAGVSSDSSCALSLLSTQQPWGTATATRTQTPSISTSSSYDSSLMAQPVIANSYATNAWGFKGNEPSSSSHGGQNTLGLGQASQSESSQFSGELELALQGNRQCMDLNPGWAYDQSDDVIHWSL